MLVDPEMMWRTACGWAVLSCPATCVDNVLCIKGYHSDSSVCACVADPAAGGCPPCPSGDVCVQQTGGTAQQIGSPPQTKCEAPEPACLARLVCDFAIAPGLPCTAFTACPASRSRPCNLQHPVVPA